MGAPRRLLQRLRFGLSPSGRLHRLLRRRSALSARLDREIREEMATHLEMRTRDHIAAGMSPAEARREAERRFGDLDSMIRRGRDARLDPRDSPLGELASRRSLQRLERLDPMRDFVSDVRYGARMMLKTPGFTMVAVLSLAFGIGFNTTLFSIIDAALFRPLAVAEPESLVRLLRVGAGSDSLGGIGDGLHSYPDFVDVREHVDSLAGVVAVRTEMTSYNLEGDAEFVFGESVSADYFDVMGVAPLVGRSFVAGEDRPGNHAVVMVAEDFWRRRLGADPAALGSELVFGGRPYTLVGVVPDRYQGSMPPIAMSFWVPSPATDVLSPSTSRSRLERRGAHGHYVFARLRDGVTREEASAEVVALGRTLAVEYPDTNAGMEFGLLPFASVRIDPVADRAMLPAAGVLMAVVGLILAIACANVANMMLARASIRRREISVRLALGAGRWRLIRQLLTESALVAVVGGIVAVIVAAATLRLLLAVQPPVMVPISLDVGIDARVMAFTGLVTVMTGLLFGLVPALQSTRADLSAAMRAEEAQDGTGTRPSRLRNGLVVVQVAVSLVLLIAASLLIRSLANAESIDPGIAQHSVVAVTPGLVFQGYDRERARDFNLQLVERVEGLSGVESVAFAERLPVDSTTHLDMDVWIEGSAPDSEPATILYATVTPSYFETLGIGIVAGRGFDARDVDEALSVAIVNGALAERFWPGVDPLGKRFSLQGPEGPFVEVVGVNAPHKVKTLGEEPTPHLYLPYAQNASTGLGTIAARIRGDAAAILAAMRREVAALDPAVALMEAETIEQHLSLSLFPVRIAAVSLLVLGALGTLLAAVGVYGVVAFAVARRTREIGVRMAVGADRRKVVRLVVRQGMRTVLVGAAIGLVASLLVTRVLGAVLYGISATDLVALSAALITLLAIGAAANVIPARRASRVDPVTALRAE